MTILVLSDTKHGIILEEYWMEEAEKKNKEYRNIQQAEYEVLSCKFRTTDKRCCQNTYKYA
jgi:hypothetical protein